MRPLLFAFPGNERRAQTLALLCGAEVGRLNFRRFPDGESYFRLEPDLATRSAAFVCTLDHPDAKLTALAMAAETARELGARRIGLIAPYLPYMRQDRRFHPGEPVSARLVGRMLSRAFDWLVTVDPHLHRITRLSQAYALGLGVVAAAPLLAQWIAREVKDPLIVGPDFESRQWAAGVAERLGAPHAVLGKMREGDEAVEVTAPELTAYSGRTAVLVDDIVSSGATLIEAARQLKAQGFERPVCAVVHALSGEDTTAELERLGARLVSVDTVAHPSNAICCDPLLASETGQLL
jgi:ribose-phosphate pyrophosphokinase